MCIQVRSWRHPAPVWPCRYVCLILEFTNPKSIWLLDLTSYNQYCNSHSLMFSQTIQNLNRKETLTLSELVLAKVVSETKWLLRGILALWNSCVQNSSSS
jgi:hypothetical protein